MIEHLIYKNKNRLMNILKRLWRKTFTYKLYDVFASLFYYVRDNNRIHDVFHGEQFRRLLKQYLNTDFNKDWLGRLYGVINPVIDINGHFNINNTIIEIDGNNTNNDEHIKTWIYRQMQIIGDVFRMHNLYDYIDLDIRHVGPQNFDNYLLVFDVVSRQQFTYALKRMLRHAVVLSVIASVVLLTLSYFIF